MAVQERRDRMRAATVAAAMLACDNWMPTFTGAPAAAQTTDTRVMTRRYAFTNMVNE